MLAGFWLRPAAPYGRSALSRYAARAVFVAVALLAQGCTAGPPPIESVLQSADPSEPAIRVPAAAYRPVLSGYTSGRPAEPKSWTGSKDGAAPPQKDGR